MVNVLLDVRKFGQAKYGSMKAFAEALGISPQNLNSYLKGERKPGTAFLDRLLSVGFDIRELATSSIYSVTLDNTDISKLEKESCVIPDIRRACRLLSCTPEELAQSVGAPRYMGHIWEAGDERPSYDQLVMLYHQILAIAVHCCETERRPAVQEERRAAAG